MCKVRIINISAILTLAAILAVVCSENAAAAGKIDVRGDQAIYSADGSRAEFNGNVVIRTISATVHATQLVISVQKNGNHYFAQGDPATAVCLSCAQMPIHLSAAHISLQENNKIYLLGGGLTLCAGNDDCHRGKLHAEHAEWRRADGKMYLRGTPIRGYWRLQEDDKTTITIRARQVEYDIARGEVKLSGDALLAREKDEIRGDTVIFNIKTGALSANSDNKNDSGRVRGVFGTDE